MSFITYKQYDSRWGKKNYNGSSTMATAGCGPTSVADLAFGVDGKTTPLETMKFMQKNGYAIRNKGTAWAGIPACMKAFNLQDVKNVAKMDDVWKYLSKGYVAIFLFSAGKRGGICWTTQGHYIAVTDYKVEKGKHKLYTRDSGSRNHTGWYCYETQMRGLIPQIWVGRVPAAVNLTKKKTYTGEFPTVNVKKGDKGEAVKLIQKFLNWSLAGAFNTEYIKKLAVDGDAGVQTDKAIKLFQTIHSLTVDGIFGPASRAKGTTMELTGAMKAVNWAVAISLDNSFAYGAGRRAHRSGCYFCGTNTGPKKKNKEKKGEPHYVTDSEGKKHTYEKTYCCNTFITAAYAHGPEDTEIKKICAKGSCCGMDPSDWKKSKFFKTVGKCKDVAFKNLRPGDVIISNGDKGAKHHHVWMYVGGDKFVHASGNNWTKKSIAILSGAKAMYEKSYAPYSATYVMRYIG